MKYNTNPVRGMRDFLPSEMEVRTYVEQVIATAYRENGFSRIATPVLENIELLNSSDGGDNLKLMYKVLKRGNKLDLSKEDLKDNDLVDAGMRYDLTLPLSRFFANNRANLTFPFKAIQIDNAYRAERPQKGRYREFKQCDVDILGDPTIAAEIDVLTTTNDALKRLGFENFTFKINDRRILNELVINAGFIDSEVYSVLVSYDKFDKIGLDGVKEDLLKNEFNENVVNAFIDMISKIETVNDLKQFGLSEELVKDLNLVIETLQKIDVKIEFEKSLVRGQGYYTGIIFECQIDGVSYSVGGGGRYDKMIGKMTGNDIPAVGFSIGFERICLELTSDKLNKVDKKEKIALLFNDEDKYEDVFSYKKELIEKDFIVSVIKEKKKLGKQIDSLSTNGFNSFTIMSKKEIKSFN